MSAMTSVMGHEGRVGASTDAGTRRDARLRHDLRQSLAVVRALVSVATADVPDAQLGTDTLQGLRLVQREVDWMVELLSSEHSEDRDGGPVADVVDLGEVVSDAWRSVAATAPCDLRLLREPGVAVMADAVELRRSACNLIDNAVRAAGAGGRVDLHVRSAGSRAVLEVTDDGPGFGRIPRQQGLGLQTVRLFAAEVRGSLEVGRSPSGDTRLTLTMPRWLPVPSSWVGPA
jgi:signal transduction histidine kinase